MSLKKRKSPDIDTKEYLRGSLSDNKFLIVGVVVFTALWVFNIFWQLISVFELILIILSIIFVVILSVLTIRNEMSFNIALDTFENNPDTQRFLEKIENLSDEEIEEVIEIIKNKE